MATRAASICFVSSQQRSIDCNPYSPNATLLPREARPARLPRCILRYFTLAGINGIKIFYKLKWLMTFVLEIHQAAAGAGVGAGVVSDRDASFFSTLVSPLQIQHFTPSLP